MRYTKGLKEETLKLSDETKILSRLCDATGIEKNGGDADYVDKDEISDWRSIM